MDEEHAQRAAKAAERRGAQEGKVVPVFVFEEVEKAAGGVGLKYEDIVEVDMRRDAGVLPASSVEASVQQQHEAEDEELGDAEAEVVDLGAGATPTVYTPSRSNSSSGESGGVSSQ